MFDRALLVPVFQGIIVALPYWSCVERAIPPEKDTGVDCNAVCLAFYRSSGCFASIGLCSRGRRNHTCNVTQSQQEARHLWPLIAAAGLLHCSIQNVLHGSIQPRFNHGRFCREVYLSIELWPQVPVS